MKKRVKFVVEVMDHVLELVPKEKEWVSRISAVYESMIVLVLLPYSLENNLERGDLARRDGAWWLNACQNMKVRNSDVN